MIGIQCKAIKAGDIENYIDHFIYLPNEKRFFLVNDVDIEENEVILYFEEDIIRGKLIDHELRIDLNEFIYVVIR